MDCHRDQPPRLVFFGHDSNEPTIIKRMNAFAAAGSQVAAFTFTRRRPGAVPALDFDNVHLGFTKDRDYLGRVSGLMRGLLVTVINCRALRRADIIYARNIDMALIALFAKRLIGARATLAYEVLDIQRILLCNSPASKIICFAERMVLAASDMLIVSSPDFMNNYFKTRQQYSGPWYLLENKVPAGQWQSDINTDPPSAPPWVIGWFGRLRCRKSLDILSMIAERLGDHVFIDIRGLPSEQDLTIAAINEAVARHPNIRYGGVYSSPCDLSHIYGKVHFSWCIDFLDTGTNSDWLLPNRLYEGGLFAVPAFTRAGTAAARKVEADGIGVAFDEPLEEGIGKFLKGLRFTDYESLRGRVRELPRSKFVDSQDTKELLLALFNRQNLAAGCANA